MSTQDVIVSLGVGIFSSIIATYIYDKMLRNKYKEPEYIIYDHSHYAKPIMNISDREMNRRRFFQMFLTLFSIYLIWASLYGPLLIKAGIFSNTLNLSNSNLAFFLKELNISISLVFDLKPIKWYCLGLSIILLIPSFYFKRMTAVFFLKIRNVFYEQTYEKWDLYRFYGLLIYIALLLIFNIFFISLFSFFNSITIGMVIILLFLVKANEK
jgi:hypothetical protein